MKTIETSNGTWCFVEVPKGYSDSRIVGDKLEMLILYPLWRKGVYATELESVSDVMERRMPKGDWQIFADDSTNLTEQQAAEISGREFDYCENDEGHGCVSCSGHGKGDCDAVMRNVSFASLLTINSITTRCIILKLTK